MGTISAPKRDEASTKIEEDRLKRTMSMLDKQYSEGILSKEAYASMKKRTEERMNAIKKK